MYLLDINACIRILNGGSATLIAHLRQHNPEEIYLSSVVKAELVYGAFRSSRAADNLRLLRRFVQPFVSLPFDDRCADHCGRIRRELESGGTPIDPNDLMIAATAVAHDFVLITNNTREFGRVVGLEIDDWEED